MLRFIFNLLLSSLLLALLIAASLTFYIVPKLPAIETLRNVQMQTPLRIYSQDLSLIAEFGEKRRLPIAINKVPQQLINAFIAIEDNRFYQHPGVDWQGIARAAMNLMITGEKNQGGSTITMQTARNFFFSREKTYLRKLNEIFLSFKIENALSKNEILELYLNKIFFGHRAYGIGAAAAVYYGTDISGLTLPQIAMIAGLPKAPSKNNPISNPDRAVQRRNLVLQRMHTLGYIDEQEFEQARAAPVTASRHRPDLELDAPYVAEMVRKHLSEEYGEDVDSRGYKVITSIRDLHQTAANYALRKNLLDYDKRHGYRGPEAHHELKDAYDEAKARQILAPYATISALYPGLVIAVRNKSITAYLTGIGLIDVEWDGLKWARQYISVNRRGAAPKTAAEILQAGDIVRITENDQGNWRLAQLPAVEGGILSLRPDDGATLALAGGFDFKRSKFNRITQSRRQPGSAFKPFIYSAGLDAGHTAASLINDAPVVFDDRGIGNLWRPENYSGKNFGLTRLREALIRSRNLVSVKLLNDIGLPKALTHIAKFGFETEKLPSNLSLALGSGAVSPWQLAKGYSTLANGGFAVEPYFIKRIETYAGETLYAASPRVACHDCKLETATGADKHLLDNTADEPEAQAPLANAEAQPPPRKNAEAQAPLEQQPYAERVIDPRNIAIMQSMMKDVIQNGTGRRARVLKRRDLAGKTGTTNNQRDAWFAGFTPALLTVVWVGFDDFESLGAKEEGASAALPMWIEYMRIALDGMPETSLERPAGLVNARIDPSTGKLASTAQTDAIFEIFRSENVPTETLEDPGKTQTPEQLF